MITITITRRRFHNCFSLTEVFTSSMMYSETDQISKVLMVLADLCNANICRFISFEKGLPTCMPACQTSGSRYSSKLIMLTKYEFTW